MVDILELHVTPKKHSNKPDRRGKKPRKSVTSKNRPIDPDDPREQKYIGIRLYHSNRWKTDNKAKFRTLSMVSKDEYLSSGDAKDILLTKRHLDTLYELSKTRDIAKQEALLRLGTKKPLTGTRNEAIAKFVTGWKGKLPHTFNRYGNLVARNKRRAEVRKGSSRNKVRRTTTSGFKEFNKDYKLFTRNLLKIFALDSRKSRKMAKGLAKKVRITVKG